ncbi:MAG: hypothetical protein N838_01920 [Thiohalocapsa sp. PB-PSB1]|nr:MAG: hypothetical protein N838_01920 [Thiohalocapsa sp. PB-PSB1]
MAIDAVQTLGHLVRPSHVLDRHPKNTELLMSELHFVFDYDNDNDNDNKNELTCSRYF